MYSSYLVINVCNQGNTLCSPCSIKWFTMALGSTQPLTEMSTTSISWG